MANYPKEYPNAGEGKPTKDPKPVLTPDSPFFNPDSVTGRFPTKSPRPK